MEWQSIETAPKDWVPVLVLAISENEKDDAEDEGRKARPSILIARHSKIQPGTWWLHGGNMTLVFNPTHWMPLPPAPETD